MHLWSEESVVAEKESRTKPLQDLRQILLWPDYPPGTQPPACNSSSTMTTATQSQPDVLTHVPPDIAAYFRLVVTPTDDLVRSVARLQLTTDAYSQSLNFLPNSQTEQKLTKSISATSLGAPLDSGPNPANLPFVVWATRPSFPATGRHDQVIVRVEYCQSHMDVTFLFDLTDPERTPDIIIPPTAHLPRLPRVRPFRPTWPQLTRSVSTTPVALSTSSLNPDLDTASAQWTVKVLANIRRELAHHHHQALRDFPLERIPFEYGCWKDQVGFEGRVVYSTAPPDSTNRIPKPTQVLLRIPLLLPKPVEARAKPQGATPVPAGSLWVTYTIPSDLNSKTTNDVADVTATCALRPPWLQLTKGVQLPPLVKTRSLVDYVKTLTAALARKMITAIQPIYDRLLFGKALVDKCRNQVIEYDSPVYSYVTILGEVPLTDSDLTAGTTTTTVPMATALVTCRMSSHFPLDPMTVRLTSPLHFADAQSHHLFSQPECQWQPSDIQKPLSAALKEWQAFINRELINFHRLAF
ncbi:hypothetical protein H4R33_002386 [Dimargaris cristalligena]|uniref:BRISC and BRCA1-A complex member 2 n=1 Tax=Dimargaris cristalligena TaxID=215637 RepID=A0A4P9ZZS7_9FUNG|nr:hypothetical protein H4R33_002386 [Dimargaris cristalligena]RKP39217.1 hypothetical protein BJ085DRAFT_30297 [Dimargaris cristalligena]|eukprot:RKP39217.1 hypothetical protein BJ085DRAFT_30297 [Dimargaris cristalligena]